MKPIKWHALLTLGIALVASSSCFAQKSLPVIRSGTTTISIRDGKWLGKNSWHLNPATKPDVYFTQVPKGNRKITFITDRDSISFVTEYGKSYDFIILVNDKDSCLTRISANYQGALNPIRFKKNLSAVADTIPFFMKKSRLYFKGKLNGNHAVNIMFDLGAGITCLNINSAAKSAVKFDGTIGITNSNGTNSEPSSSRNSLEIGGLKWEKVPLVQVKNLAKDEDMIVGNSLFQDKIVEIDYDKKIMVITNQLQKDLTTYSVHDVAYEQHRPSFEMNVKIGERYYPYHFLFDTGRDGTMLIGEDFTSRYELWEQYNSLLKMGTKKIVRIPEVKIGTRMFKDIVTNASDPKHPTGKQSLIGNELLNQFNVVLDNTKGVLYLKPNGLQNENYATYKEFRMQVMMFIGSVVLVALAVVFLWKRWRRRRKQKHMEIK